MVLIYNSCNNIRTPNENKIIMHNMQKYFKKNITYKLKTIKVSMLTYNIPIISA